MHHILFLISFFLQLLSSGTTCFLHVDRPRHFSGSKKLLTRSIELESFNEGDSNTVVQSYKHKEWNLTYLYKPASQGFECIPPLLLIHPVGIGLSSWFWLKFIGAWGEGPALYAVDLIGCGLEHGADPWDPQKDMLFFPLSWVEGCETLINTVIIPRLNLNLIKKPGYVLFQQNGIKADLSRCIIMTQGGIAPVGILLAQRNPDSISKLILSSPPSWTDMTTAVPNLELERNYGLLSSSLLGNVVFRLLETRVAIRLFSNIFLFAAVCDDDWVAYAFNASTVSELTREPVKVFNAGFLNHRSFQFEMNALTQSTLIISGLNDTRTSQRLLYQTQMKNCLLRSVVGLNVLPWENALNVCALVKWFAYGHTVTLNET